VVERWLGRIVLGGELVDVGQKGLGCGVVDVLVAGAVGLVVEGGKPLLQCGRESGQVRVGTLMGGSAGPWA
jgi:hypothetical protein